MQSNLVNVFGWVYSHRMAYSVKIYVINICESGITVPKAHIAFKQIEKLILIPEYLFGVQTDHRPIFCSS